MIISVDGLILMPDNRLEPVNKETKHHNDCRAIVLCIRQKFKSRLHFLVKLVDVCLDYLTPEEMLILIFHFT